MGLFRSVWGWLTGETRRTFAKEFAKLSPEGKFMYHALRGTSVEDRQWMMGLR